MWRLTPLTTTFWTSKKNIFGLIFWGEKLRTMRQQQLLKKVLFTAVLLYKVYSINFKAEIILFDCCNFLQLRKCSSKLLQRPFLALKNSLFFTCTSAAKTKKKEATTVNILFLCTTDVFQDHAQWIGFGIVYTFLFLTG